MKEHTNLKSLFSEHKNEMTKAHSAFESMREHIATYNFEEFQNIEKNSVFCYNEEGEFLGVNANSSYIAYGFPTYQSSGSDLLSMYFRAIHEEFIAWTDANLAFTENYTYSLKKARKRMKEHKKIEIPEELRNFKPSLN